MSQWKERKVGEPFYKRAYAWASEDLNQHTVLLWIWLVVGSYLTFGGPNLKNSVPWVSFMSLYAIVAGHWAGMEGAKTLKSQEMTGYQEAP